MVRHQSLALPLQIAESLAARGRERFLCLCDRARSQRERRQVQRCDSQELYYGRPMVLNVEASHQILPAPTRLSNPQGIWSEYTTYCGG